MIKKMTLAIVMVFCMVSFATAAANYDYIPFPEDGYVEVTLLEAPSNSWGMWDVMLYDFTIEGDGSITVNGMLDLFWDRDSQGAIIYLSIDGNMISNGLTYDGDDGDNIELEMTSSNLGIAFGYGPDDNYNEWYSHASLNDDGDLFDVTYFGDPGNGMAQWFINNGQEPDDSVGMINMRVVSAPVPVSASAWLLGSGLIGLIGWTRKIN